MAARIETIKAPDDHYVYVIGTIAADESLIEPVKVGITSSPALRLSTLRTASPNRIELAHVFILPDRIAAAEMEAAFHRRHDSCRLNGEWFDMGPLAAMEALCNWLRGNFESLRLASDFDELHLWRAVNRSRLYEAERKCADERYLAAWEG